MKTVFTFLLLLSAVLSKGQGLSQSTMREVYNLHPGDTLEYIADHINVNGYAEIRSYTLRVIQSRLDAGDSITLLMNDKTIYTEVYHTIPAWGDTFLTQMLYTHLDSAVLFDHRSTLGCDSNHFFCHRDTSFTDSTLYHGREITEHWAGNQNTSADDTTFTDGLGITSGRYGSEDNLEEQGGFYLAYYHLASGEVWGSPSYFQLPNGIRDIISTSYASVSPDPVKTSFQIKLNISPSAKTIFNLYDETGRSVRQKEIVNANTVADRDNIPAGIYLWNIQSEEIVIAHGRLIFE